MTEYDPKVINKFADRLYSTAKTIVIAYAFLGILIGGASGYAVEQWPSWSSHGTVTVILAVTFGLIGFLIGKEKAFRLKLLAQTALCQVKIEENTRKQ